MEEREIRSKATRLPFFHTTPLICAIFAGCVCKVFAVMDKEWMYKTSRLDQAYLDHVTKFIAAAKRHRLSLKWEHTICSCKSCKNLLLHEDYVVKSHLVRYGLSRITPSGSFMGKQRIQVPVHLEETRQQRRWQR